MFDIIWLSFLIVFVKYNRLLFVLEVSFLNKTNGKHQMNVSKDTSRKKNVKAIPKGNSREVAKKESAKKNNIKNKTKNERKIEKQYAEYRVNDYNHIKKRKKKVGRKVVRYLIFYFIHTICNKNDRKWMVIWRFSCNSIGS